MSLLELVDDSFTDKNTTHSYLPLYQTLLEGKKESAKNVLEVGIYMGGSIQLWSRFFTNATVHALDVMPLERVRAELKADAKVVLHTSTDAYNEQYFKTHFLGKVQFDFMLDDGPHSIESMIQFIQLYSQLLTPDGILIVEDVQHVDWLAILTEHVPEHLKPFVKTYDLRPNKGRYDDIVFTIDRTLQPGC